MIDHFVVEIKETYNSLFSINFIVFLPFSYKYIRCLGGCTKFHLVQTSNKTEYDNMKEHDCLLYIYSFADFLGGLIYFQIVKLYKLRYN